MFRIFSVVLLLLITVTAQAQETVDPMIGTGGLHTCYLKVDGSVDCWGSNEQGQAEDQAGLFTQISAGGSHTCGLRADGSVDCWGFNTDGQAEDQVGPFTQISAGGSHTCGLKDDGSVDCWGHNADGAADDQVGPFTQVSAGGNHTCGLKDDGSVDCWGFNGDGAADDQAGEFAQISAGGNHTCGLKTDGSADCWGNNEHGQANDQAGTFTQISAGGNHTCGIKNDGSADCWGNNEHGQANDQAGPFTQIITGQFHTCGLTTNARVDCWGNNFLGQSNSPYSSQRYIYLNNLFVIENTTAVGNFTTFGAEASTTFTYTLAAGAGDTDNAFFSISGDQLSFIIAPDYETQSSYHVRVQSEDENGITAQTAFTITVVDMTEGMMVSSGSDHTCYLKVNGSVDCWGDNTSGQADDQPGPFVQISAGQDLTCGLKVDGSVDCWGNNGSGQANDQPGPFSQISVGLDFGCGLKADGSVDCWDNGPADMWGPFTQIAAGVNICGLRINGDVFCWGGDIYDETGPFTQVSSGGNHICGLRTDGSVTCFGDSLYGQSVSQTGPFTQVSAGYYHSCGLRTDGSVDCWRTNTNGQANDQAGPFIQISAGRSHTCGLRADGAVDCWGDLSDGQTNSPYASPTDILLSVVSVDETTMPVIYLLSEDPNGGTFTYTLVAGDGDTNNGSFTINGDQLSLLTAPDYEQQPSYSIRIQTQDSDGFTFQKTFTIKVNDLLDQAMELTMNGGFELQGSSPAVPLNWKRVNTERADLRVCPATVNATIHSGACAFRFNSNGNTTPKEHLLQNVLLTDVSSGGTLNVSLWARGGASNKVNIAVKGTIVYRNTLGELSREAVTFTTIRGIIPTYTQKTGSVQLTSGLTPVQVKLVIQNRGTAGNVFIDDVSVTASDLLTRGFFELPYKPFEKPPLP